MSTKDKDQESREGGRQRERERITETYIIDLLISLCHDAQFGKDINQLFIDTFWVHFQDITQHLNGSVSLLSLMIKLSIIILMNVTAVI